MLDSNYLITLKQILINLEELNLFVVGGAVRELMLEKLAWTDAKVLVPDIDLLTSADFNQCLSNLEQNSDCVIKRHAQFLTAKIEYKNGVSFDIVQTRAESYPSSGSLPQVRAGSFLEDALRRDFAINSMRIRLADYIRIIEDHLDLDHLKLLLEDQLQGLSDLQDRLIRVLHEQSFYDDPTRIFRALRYKARLKGNLAPETEKLLINAIQEGYLLNISSYRILNEVIKILAEPNLKYIVDDLKLYKIIDHLEQIGLDSLSLDQLTIRRRLIKDKSNIYLNREQVLQLIADSIDLDKAESLFVTIQLTKHHRKQLLVRKYEL